MIRLHHLILLTALCAIALPTLAQERGSLSVVEVQTMRNAQIRIALPGDPPQGRPIPATITPAQLIRAELLDFSGQPLTALPPWLSKFTQLRHLNLANTGVRIGGVEPMRSMPHLEIVNLSGNPLFDRGGDATASNALWAALPNLRDLNLANTGGTTAHYGNLGQLRNLHRLDLSGNRIESLGDLKLASLSRLQHLTLAHNALRNPDPKELPQASLQSLDLSRNRISQLRYQGDLPNLRTLHLRGNSGLKLDEEYGDLFVLQALVGADFDSNAEIPRGLRERLERATTGQKIGFQGRYRNNGDGSVTDTVTGLQWMRCAIGQQWQGGTCNGEAKEMNSEAAKRERATLAGHRDWRLPTREELRTLVYCSSGQPAHFNDSGNSCQGEYQRPTIDLEAFPSAPATWFWSSSAHSGDSSYAWNVSFSNGNDSHGHRGSGNAVRLVRGGQ